MNANDFIADSFSGLSARLFLNWSIADMNMFSDIGDTMKGAQECQITMLLFNDENKQVGRREYLRNDPE